MPRLNLGFLASHGGSAAKHLVAACHAGTLNATPLALVSNNSRSPALAWAREAGLQTTHLSSAKHPDPAALDHAILAFLTAAGVDTLVLSGYMSAWTADQLAQLLYEANAHPWESLQAALDGIEGQPHPRVAWLTTHLSVTKREYAALIAAAAGAPTPPDDAGLSALMAWEVEAVRVLTPAQLAARLTHARA